MITSGRHSRCLWGPGEGLGACDSFFLINKSREERESREKNIKEVRSQRERRRIKDRAFQVCCEKRVDTPCLPLRIIETSRTSRTGKSKEERKKRNGARSFHFFFFFVSSAAVDDDDDKKETTAASICFLSLSLESTYENPAQLVKHPVLGGIEPLKVLLRAARHLEKKKEKKLSFFV